MTINSYVYMDQTNIDGADLHYSGNGLLQYNFPNQFISQYKNKLYASGSSNIYE